MRKANKQGMSGIIAREYKNCFTNIKYIVTQVSCFLIMIYVINTKHARAAAVSRGYYKNQAIIMEK